jgi:hypothetical protein
MATRTTSKRKLTDELDLLIPSAQLSPAELHNKIAVRAYEVFLARNGSGGDAIGDWLLAEQEIHKLNKTTASISDNSVITKNKRATASKSTTSRSSKPKTTSQVRTRKQKQVEE